jgi:hypothetical protein
MGRSFLLRFIILLYHIDIGKWDMYAINISPFTA